MRTNGLLDWNWLKGARGDPIHAVLCGAEHNPEDDLAHLRMLYCAFVGQLMLALMGMTPVPRVLHSRRAESGLFQGALSKDWPEAQTRFNCGLERGGIGAAGKLGAAAVHRH